MKAIIFFFIVFFHVFSLQCIYAQPSNDAEVIANSSIIKTWPNFQHETSLVEDSSSTKISAMPIIAFGLGWMILGGIIGEKIDQGGAFEFTEAERTGALIGVVSGVTIGYFIAKKDQKRKIKQHKKKNENEFCHNTVDKLCTFFPLAQSSVSSGLHF